MLNVIKFMLWTKQFYDLSEFLFYPFPRYRPILFIIETWAHFQILWKLNRNRSRTFWVSFFLGPRHTMSGSAHFHSWVCWCTSLNSAPHIKGNYKFRIYKPLYFVRVYKFWYDMMETKRSGKKSYFLQIE